MMRFHADGGVEFRLVAPTARVVELTLDFGGDRIRTLGMRRDGEGCWILRLHAGLELRRYRFRVDGRPFAEPDACRLRGADQAPGNPPLDDWSPIRRAA